jgi:hypothetical protein
MYGRCDGLERLLLPGAARAHASKARTTGGG